MAQIDRDQYLYDTFCVFWPPWQEHIDHWEHYADNTILVTMKNDGHVTSGSVYIFGDDGCEKWHMERMKT